VRITLSKQGETEFVHEPTGSRVKMIGTSRSAYVTGVHTPPEHRGKGGAHEVMRKLTAHLDAHGTEAMLVAKPQDETTKKGRLEAFYRKHGFKKDGPDMRRKPKTLREFLDER
jgi:ribosomal protein S18 acetylase RimI-like enzyme